MEPVTATAIATGVGALGNVLGNWYQSSKNEEAMKYQAEQMRIANQQRQEAIAKLIEYYGGAENLQREYAKYKAEVEAFDPTVQMPEFIFDSDVGRYLDPSMQYQLDVANRTLQSGLQGKGGLYSGKAMKALQEQGQKFAQTDYNNAFTRMTTDRQFSYQDYINRFNNTKANKQAEFNRLSGLFKNAGDNRDTIAELMGQSGNLNANLTDALGANRAKFIQGQGDMWGGTIRNVFSPKNAGAVLDYFNQPKEFDKEANALFDYEQAGGDISTQQINDFNTDLMNQGSSWGSSEWDNTVSTSSMPLVGAVDPVRSRDPYFYPDVSEDVYRQYSRGGLEGQTGPRPKWGGL